MKAKRGVVFSLRRSSRQMPVGRRAAPFGAQGPEGHHVGVALRRVVDDGVEPDEGVVPGGVLVGRGGELRRIGGPDGRVRAVRPTGRVGHAAVP